MNGEPKDLQEQIDELKTVQAVQAAAFAGAQATQAAVTAGAHATQAAVTAGVATTGAAATAGVWSMMAAGFVALVTGLILGNALRR